MLTANIVPGQGFQQFEILSKKGGTTKTGRAWSGGYNSTGEYFWGLLVGASQREEDQWKQAGHPVTHKIIGYSAMMQLKPTDYLMLEDGRKFYVQGKKNHADMNVSCSYYVEERDDLKWV